MLFAAPSLRSVHTLFAPFPLAAALLFTLEGRMKRFKPSQGVLIGDSPVKIKASYKNPPKVQPMNGHIMGTQK